MKAKICSLLVASFAMSSASFGASKEPVRLKISHDYRSYARPWGFGKVKLLSAEKVVEKAGVFENLSMKFVFEAELKTLGGGGELQGIEIVSAQRSIDNSLNPSDIQLRVKSKPVEGISVGGGGTTNVRFETKEYITQRKQGAKEWPPYNKPFDVKTRVKFYSFDAGMVGGYLPWHLYKLDFGDIENATLDYQSSFAYVQGKIEEFDKP